MIVGPDDDDVLNWHRWFAWRPVRLLEGGRAWCRFVYWRGIPRGLGLQRSVIVVYSQSPEERDVDIDKAPHRR